MFQSSSATQDKRRNYFCSYNLLVCYIQDKIVSDLKHLFLFETNNNYFVANTVHICYLKYPLSRTFIFSSFLFGPFSTLGNCSYRNSFVISNPAISNCHHVQLFFRSPQRFSELFSIHYLEHFHFTHSNAEKQISKLYSNVYVFLFNHNHMSGTIQYLNFLWKKIKPTKC